MANEISISLAVAYEDSVGMKGQIDISNLLITLTQPYLHHSKQNVAITQEAIGLGDIVTIPSGNTLGIMILVNRDPTNYIEVKHATSGTIIAKLFPKVASGATGLNWCCLQVGSGITAPFVIANSAVCQMEIFICTL